MFGLGGLPFEANPEVQVGSFGKAGERVLGVWEGRGVHTRRQILLWSVEKPTRTTSIHHRRNDNDGV